jgi:hypothetical protein
MLQIKDVPLHPVPSNEDSGTEKHSVNERLKIGVRGNNCKLLKLEICFLVEPNLAKTN